MGAWKQLLTEDVIVTPFEVNKGFSFPQSEFADANVQINRLLGVSGSWTSNQNTTGTSGTQYEVPVYNSIKQLYYSNFLSSSRGDTLATASLLPGEDEAGDVFFGLSTSRGRYENYLQTTLTQSRYFPTGSASISIISIPSRLWGDYILPTSFIFRLNSNFTAYDDGNGNLFSLTSSGSIAANEKVGDIIYPHGMVVFTNQNLALSSIISSTNVTCSFSSSYDLYETQWKATIRESEFNFSQNPTIISGSSGGDAVSGFATGSYFQPYATTVGLYDDNQDLLAVGKLSTPYPLSRTTDTTFYINIDR
tara:strand:+ start:984 stop:1904 length:921 start_codon:yes stop_codon:yes gene_type:complete